jgi:hypothetical protein
MWSVGLDGPDVFYAHEESALKLVDGPEARRKMHQTICAMTGMALDLATPPRTDRNSEETAAR